MFPCNVLSKGLLITIGFYLDVVLFLHWYNFILFSDFSPVHICELRFTVIILILWGFIYVVTIWVVSIIVISTGIHSCNVQVRFNSTWIVLICGPIVILAPIIIIITHRIFISIIFFFFCTSFIVSILGLIIAVFFIWNDDTIAIGKCKLCGQPISQHMHMVDYISRHRQHCPMVAI